MRILVYPHDLDVGGSQLNAIELAAAVRGQGHEAVVFGRSGALNARVAELGLEFVDAPPPGRRPSSATADALVDVVRSRGIDIIHGYEWPPTLDAVLAVRRGAGARVVSTVMSMSVPPFVPRSVPLIVGTEQIAAVERHTGRSRVSVLEPPVDLSHNDIAIDNGVDRFRARFGIADDRLTVVSIARFAQQLKLEGTLAAIEAIGSLASSVPIRLVLVGDGPARSAIEERAHAVNAAHGEGTVVLTGAVDDPRAAYASADIALGMGGSALRALAYGKPLIVQGERGFWSTLTPESLPRFLWEGWYGVGDGPRKGVDALRAELHPLVSSARRRAELGNYGLQVVRERFSLTRAALIQSGFYEEALAKTSSFATASELAALVRYAGYYLGKRARRAAGRERMDDFNARPALMRRVRS